MLHTSQYWPMMFKILISKCFIAASNIDLKMPMKVHEFIKIIVSLMYPSLKVTKQEKNYYSFFYYYFS